MNKTALFYDEIFTKHLENDTNHPESAKRLIAIHEALETHGLAERVERLPIRPASEKEILLNHTKDHLFRIASTKEKPFSTLDPDTWASERSYEAALNGVGASIELVNAVWDGITDNGMILPRPPGHHAVADRTMGFCLFNNIAVATHHLIRHRGVKRVAIVDIDVHHGNGTQDSFYDRSDVFYLSTHQYPFFPGSGLFEQIGEGDGEGYSLNIPMPYGQSADEYLPIYKDLMIPPVLEYEPEIILVSFGVDIHKLDPIGGMTLETEEIGRIVKMLLDAADNVCDGKIAFFLEGGYNLKALADSTAMTIKELLGVKADLFYTDEIPSRPKRLEPLYEKVESIHGKYWKSFQ